MIRITPMTKNDFYHAHIPTVFHDEEYARHYYEVSSDGKSIFKFSMQSEIFPVFIEMSSVVAVGCDQTVIFFCLDNNKIIKRMLLSSFFYDFKLSDKYIYIICEIEVIILLRENLEEYKNIEFIEYIDHVDINKSDMLVHFIDGSSESICI